MDPPKPFRILVQYILVPLVVLYLSILYIVKDRKCSWHYHKIKDETFYVQSGKIILYHSTIDRGPDKANKVVLGPGDHFHIPVGLIHQMYALEDTELFEFSTQHFDEDSYRLEKGD